MIATNLKKYLTDLAVRLNAMLKAVELPASIANLDAALTQVNRLRGKAAIEGID